MTPQELHTTSTELVRRWKHVQALRLELATAQHRLQELDNAIWNAIGGYPDDTFLMVESGGDRYVLRVLESLVRGGYGVEVEPLYTADDISISSDQEDL